MSPQRAFAERHTQAVLQVVKARVLDAKQTALEKKVSCYTMNCLYEACSQTLGYSKNVEIVCEFVFVNVHDVLACSVSNLGLAAPCIAVPVHVEVLFEHACLECSLDKMLQDELSLCR